jgi:hypothetical protein
MFGTTSCSRIAIVNAAVLLAMKMLHTDGMGRRAIVALALLLLVAH